GSILSTIPREENEWQTHACVNSIVTGFDNTNYVVQVGPASSYPYRVVAFRNGTKLWIGSFPDPEAGCSKRPARIQSMAMGQDGNIYAAVYWTYKSETCPERDALASLDPSTGNSGPVYGLPNTGSSSRGPNISEVQPYKDGVAVLNGNEVFYYNYKGEKESGKTFTATSEGTIIEFKIVPATGRIYWWYQVYNPEAKKWEKLLYYRNPEGSNEEVELSGEKELIGIDTIPSNGVVAKWKEGSTKGFTYIDEEGSEVYQKVLSTETEAVVQDAGLPYGLVVDDSGNVIVRRMIDQTSGDNDRNIVVDSFSPEGTKTRLFNSSSFGTGEVVDAFTSTSSLPQSIGEGHVYLTLCHVEGEITSGCNSAKEPVVVSISDIGLGNYDYPRSAIFSAGLEQSSYVALGDSFASGEGVPDFIPPSDENGCHRSYEAHPWYLTLSLKPEPPLRLDAFVACSGAKTIDVEEGMNGEQAQLNSLNSDTDIVTISVGGNDIGFRNFAKECFVKTCNSSSPAYEYSMEQIELFLPESLEDLYKEVHNHAENAEVYVVGYPQVAPEPGIECAFLIDSEKEAAREVVAELDKAIEEAVENTGAGSVYIDPLSEESPFVGHELCTEESYFNWFEIFEIGYSLHPNSLGQYAYSELIAEAL
ncbi:MAG TPA: SGNH/GDSL hydrolase family protein, partial [Candidatus Saccharimonadales bacterium]|nr:SGNH/GDSL hydrolase family protein [Candidatus Saccharimonadales bacterium]